MTFKMYDRKSFQLPSPAYDTLWEYLAKIISQTLCFVESYLASWFKGLVIFKPLCMTC